MEMYILVSMLLENQRAKEFINGKMVVYTQENSKKE
jgi:hypothetical protein